MENDDLRASDCSPVPHRVSVAVEWSGASVPELFLSVLRVDAEANEITAPGNLFAALR